MEIFNFPIEVLKATIALLAIVALLHKSDETQKQIMISESQNNFSNHFKHMEEFFKYIDLFDIKSVEFHNRKLHAKLYPRSKRGELNISKEVIDEVRRNTESIIQHIKRLSTMSKDNLNDIYNDSISNFDIINDTLRLFYFDIKPNKLIINSKLTDKSAFLFCMTSLNVNLLCLYVLNFIVDFDGIECFSIESRKIINAINLKDVEYKILKIKSGNSNIYGVDSLAFDFEKNVDNSIDSINMFKNIIENIIKQ